MSAANCIFRFLVACFSWIWFFCSVHIRFPYGVHLRYFLFIQHCLFCFHRRRKGTCQIRARLHKLLIKCREIFHTTLSQRRAYSQYITSFKRLSSLQKSLAPVHHTLQCKVAELSTNKICQSRVVTHLFLLGNCRLHSLGAFQDQFFHSCTDSSNAIVFILVSRECCFSFLHIIQREQVSISYLSQETITIVIFSLVLYFRFLQIYNSSVTE